MGMMNDKISNKQRESIVELINKGDYQLVSELLEDLEKEGDLSSIDNFYLFFYKSRIFNDLGFFDKGLEMAEKAYTKSEELESIAFEIDSLSNVVSALNHLGKLEESGKLLAKIEELINKLTDEDLIHSRKALLYKQKGVLEKISGNIDNAIDLFEQSYSLTSNNGTKYEFADVLNNQGLIYANIGNLDKSMLLLAQSLAMFQEIGNLYKIAGVLNSLGEICRQKGYLDQALRHFQQSVAIWEEIGNKEAIAKSLTNIGTIYYSMGEFRKASVNFDFGLELFKEIGNFMSVAENLYSQILLNLIQGKITDAEKYYDELAENNKQHPHKPTNQLLRLSKALILKNKGPFRNLVKAIEILQEIVAEDIMNYEIMVDALLNLCELYLAEFKITTENETLDDLESAILTLENIAKNQKSQKLFATAYWLKAHISLIKLDLDEAKNLLIKAQNLAEDIGLQTLALKISNDYDQLLSSSENWVKLKEENAPFSQRLELSQVDELVNSLLHDKIENIEEIPDEIPVFVTILEKSGSSIYSKEFSDKCKIDDQLIGGFLAALNSFIGEAFFSSGGTIDRIKYQNYTFVMKPSGNFVFCYIFEGFSYFATKKLEKFIEEIHKSQKLLEAFAAFAQTGILPDNEHQESIDSITDEIFL